MSGNVCVRACVPMCVCVCVGSTDIPQVVFMTRVDLACPLVKDDLQCIYSSKNIKRKVCCLG